MVLRGAGAAAQTTAIDFDRDVKPLLRDKCVGCHGPSQQNGGLRLDRRQSALLGGASGVGIIPGNSSRSPLIWRVSGPSVFGPQMPPTGPLRADDIAMLKTWVDRGASWPEEAPSTAADTPLMRAALNGSAAEMRALIDTGADVNARNGAGATALMWAVTDAEKVRLLLDKGADVRARSEDGRTALHIAVMRSGASDVIRQLLAHGASATEKGAGALPIDIAANAGDPATLDLLLQAGAVPTEGAAANASFVECVDCIEVLRQHGLDAKRLGPALGVAIGMGGVNVVEYLLKSGAPLDASPFPMWPDYTALMIAAYSDRDPMAKVKLLLGAGADPSGKTSNGETAASLAGKRGDRDVAQLLTAAAARGDAAMRGAIEKSIALLQKSDVVFTKNTGCISCHHETLPAMLVAMAGPKRIHVDEAAARLQLQKMLAYLDERRERILQGFDIPGSPATAGYLLIALHAQGQPPSPATDALARLLQMTQLGDGRWRIQAPRPPIESTDITATAVSVRALRLYAPAARKADTDRAVAAAVKWLVSARAMSTEEKAFRLLGLAWSGAAGDVIAAAARDLAGAQRPDGGWSELSTLESDAYSTGQALFALHQASGATPADPIYRKGVAFLLNTQHDDGSWLVKTRSIPFQVYFETGFPHGPDQFISAAGTAWAAIALTLAVP